MAHLERTEEGFNTMEPDVDEEICSECTKIVHEDDCTHLFDGRMVCNWCRPDVTDQYGCNECGADFEHKGIPATCPECASANITHAYTDTHQLIEQKLVERIERLSEIPLTETVRAMNKVGCEFYQLPFPGSPSPGTIHEGHH